MSAHFEEIDRRPTPIGEISVRRRLEPSLQVDVYEVKLGDEFLMSSLFTVSEIELAQLALAEVPGTDLDVVVGGLGLGYTARAVLEDLRVRSLTVVEAVGAVIEWHRRQLLPLGIELTSDPRCRLVEGDFFTMVAGGWEFGPGAPEQWHAVLVDIDHRHNASFIPATPPCIRRSCGASARRHRARRGACPSAARAEPAFCATSLPRICRTRCCEPPGFGSVRNPLEFRERSGEGDHPPR